MSSDYDNFIDFNHVIHQLMINCEWNQSMIDVINDYNQFNQQRSDKKIKRNFIQYLYQYIELNE